MRFLGRRITHSVLVSVGVSVLVFVLLQIAPGDFASDLRLNPQLSPGTVTALRAQYGLNRNISMRYVLWLGSMMRGDFGFSLAYNMPAGKLLFVRARNTLLLTGTAALLVWIISVPIGILAALFEGRWFDHLIGGATCLLLAIPEITLALIFLMFALHTRVLPVGGMFSPRLAGAPLATTLLNLATHLVVPVAVLVAVAAPMLVRHVRASMLDALESGFIQAARSHGLPQHRIVLYAVRAAANPLISFAGLSVATLLSESLLVEVITGWPGLGPLVVESILARDLHVVVGAVLLSALCLLVGNLLADLLLYAADPRIRMEAA